MIRSSSNPFGVTIRPVTTTAVPSWVPPIGYFADVPMKNNPQDVTPAIYRATPTDTWAMTRPFNQWGGSAILRDYSPLGAQVYYAAGHEPSPDTPNVQLALICDFSSLIWSVANVPAKPNTQGSFVNGYAPDGSPYSAHTYLGLQEMPQAWGGGSKGSLVSFLFAYTLAEGKVNLLDVSSPSYGYSQLATRQPQNADPTKIRFSATQQGGSVPLSVMDPVRQGWWLATVGSVQYTLFISKTGEITQYPALGAGMSCGALVLCGSLNLLIVVRGGYSAGTNADSGYRTLHIRDLATGAVTQSLTVGDVPAVGDGYDGGVNNYHYMDATGLQWVDALGCMVGIDQSASPPQIVKLTPPASNPATAPWTWSRVPVAHWPQDAGGQPTLQFTETNVWSKFRWVPTLNAFVFGSAKDRKPQVVRIS